ncbi:ASCH domain-containing protein [Streptomyces kaniharaensis]|uniref:ASCH domain-containing protein n=1 Tax=Streptomyces kaniharaensis TaxID=212423 RepID=A0A6N7L5A1_9ACTN|nr:ASCH domain-containing protein [Streptomyces kaniharaensis]MQS17888.1 ASCH domain-containing protein [Streptomyces kaniharaensis]
MTVIPRTSDSPASHAVGVDFDLTVVAHRDGWQDGRIYGDPIPGALEAVRRLMACRSVFCVTARHRRYHPAVAAWFVRHGIPAVVDEDPDRAYWHGDKLLVTNKKLGAALYIDDRALAFTGDWAAALPEAMRRIGERPSQAPQSAASLPALTIRQPWLAAILAGDKTVENRSWPTRHRGPVVLHAARALARDGQADPLVRAVLARPGAPALTTGALVATANVTDCHRDTGCCRPWGLPGLWHWQLDDVQALPDPIPATGRLGLWRLDPGQHTLLHRHQGAASPAR